eukprot:UC1_evm1s472
MVSSASSDSSSSSGGGGGDGDDSGGGEGKEQPHFNRVIAVDMRRGEASKLGTRGNIYTLRVPGPREEGSGGSTDKLRYTLRFIFHLATAESHDAPLTFGMNRKGHSNLALCSFTHGGQALDQEHGLSGSLVVGAVPLARQARRSFQHYIELERARPARVNLHYNSWYDLATGQFIDRAQAMETIRRVGTELVARRGVQLDSFLLDDGWDDRNTVWEVHRNLQPHGLSELQGEAARYGARLGIWMSPWGGYYGRETRVAAARRLGMRARTGGDGKEYLTFTDETYRKKFEAVARKMVLYYGANMLKLDGLGTLEGVAGASEAGDEYAAGKALLP